MAEKAPRLQGRLRIWLERIGLFGPGVVLTIAAFAVAYHFVQPAPPRHIVMAAGAKDGVYYYYGRIYRDLMAQNGVELTLLATKGSTENIDLLNSGKADVGFVQGGTRGDDGGHTRLRSLASLYYEPIWVFVRKDIRIARLADLKGLRVAVDQEGSGTRTVALQLLGDVGLDAGNLRLSPLGGNDAAAALRQGTLDAAFFITAATAPAVETLFHTPEIRLLPIDRTRAFQIQHRFLSRLLLPEGGIDLKEDLPPSDTIVLAGAANLVVREDFHPALAELLLTEARRIHSYAGTFEEADEFPSRQHLEYPISDAAERFFDSGPSFLERYLPFWAANLVDRLKIMLLPLIALAYPLFKVIPPTYAWRMRSRIDRWYRELQAIEHRLGPGAGREELRRSLAEIEALERKVRLLTMPDSYGNPLYSLRLHIATLRDELNRAVAAEPRADAHGPATKAL